ncbi:hypothetical protein FQA47_016267, partial [Oryzias melastigma]
MLREKPDASDKLAAAPKNQQMATSDHEYAMEQDFCKSDREARAAALASRSDLQKSCSGPRWRRRELRDRTSTIGATS